MSERFLFEFCAHAIKLRMKDKSSNWGNLQNIGISAHDEWRRFKKHLYKVISFFPRESHIKNIVVKRSVMKNLWRTAKKLQSGFLSLSFFVQKSFKEE